MYLSEIKLWNFRKYGIKGDVFENSEPGVVVRFHDGLNVLVGENDSGKTAIIDAIRYVLGTQSREWVRIEDSDFFMEGSVPSEKLKIECIFRGFKHSEAGFFLEWMGFEENEGKQEYVLAVHLTGTRKSGRVISDLRAGPDPVGIPIEGEARDRLRVTYLKPLRDAENELTSGRKSRFAQILAAHNLFQKSKDKDHDLERILKRTNRLIKKYFDPNATKARGQIVMQTINHFLEGFFPEKDVPSAGIGVSGGDLSDILHRLELAFEGNPAGLGSLNRLFIAAELLLFQFSDYAGLKLALIEELEAHLHPQAQLLLIHFLQEQSINGQFILSTHSTTLGASIELKNLIICKGNQVFPMGPDYTKLEPENYEFLQRFIDVTKANLFFARGVILVEGDAENLLLPTIAKIIGRPLHRYGVSIVNVGSTAFLHYSRIFNRKDNQNMGIEVAIVTDIDIKPLEYHETGTMTSDKIEANKQSKLQDLMQSFNDNDVKVFVSPNWTLEYEIAISGFRKRFYTSILWAEKKQTATNGLPKDGKIEEVKETVKKNITEWESKWKQSERQNEQIAYEIYQKTLLDKEISKAITSQVFAEFLEESFQKDAEKIRHHLLRQKSLRYLIDAICHVTEPTEMTKDDSDN
jgi:putative ATP-dependent endonuclease of OLD family